MLTLSDSTLSADISYSSGGGIENASGGTLTVSNSTFYGNNADTLGGGIENAGGTLTVTDSTLSGNTAYGSGGGIDNSGLLTLQNSIVAGNTSYSTNPDLNGTISTDNGSNLLGTAVNNGTSDPTPGPGDVFSNSPMLGALGNYGGPTQTMSLLAGSPAIAAGNAAAPNLPTIDQRGLPRTVGGSLDIGAFQTQAPTVAFTTLSETAVAGQRTGSIAIELQNQDGNPASFGSVTYSANGTTADTTGASNLTLVNGASFAAGETGQALSLNGVNQYAITPNLANLFANSSTNVTISLWFNAAGAGVILDELGQTTLNAGWNDSQIEILANGTVEVRVWDLPAVTLGTASFNAWHNVVLRYNASTQSLNGFLDGVQSATSSSGSRSAPYLSGYGLYYAFGAADTTNLGSGASFHGLIENVSIFNTALSNAQVASLFGGGNAAPAPLAVTLGSSSPGGSFSYPDGQPISGGQVIVPLGASSVTVDYADTMPGTPVLTVSAPGFGSATQQETILPAAISATPSTNIVVGRTLSAYFSGQVQNNQETITYTVYNESADSETGVLLTDTLAPGVTLVERLAAARSEWPESGLELGHDRGGRLDERDNHRLACEFLDLATRHGSGGLCHAQRPANIRRDPGRHDRRGQRRSQFAGLDARRQHHRPLPSGRGGGARLQRPEHLHLPAR